MSSAQGTLSSALIHAKKTNIKVLLEYVVGLRTRSKYKIRRLAKNCNHCYCLDIFFLRCKHYKKPNPKMTHGLSHKMVIFSSTKRDFASHGSAS